MAWAAAAQPGQHMARAAPSTMAVHGLAAGAGWPQW
jgi:hypothetical protein